MASKSTTRKNKNKLAADFCRCIKRVRKSVTLRPGQPKTEAAKEAAAIAICVKSVLQTKGRTLKQFRCGGAKGTYLQTQKPLKGGAVLLGNIPSVLESSVQQQPIATKKNEIQAVATNAAPPSQGILERITSVFQ